MDLDVLVVGGGPVGLTARALLARWGLRTLLVEKYAELSPFPRSRLINVRSMEIFRGLGIADQIAARAFAPEYGRIRFRDTLADGDFASAAMVGVNAPIPESPTIGVVTSQDRLEPTLLGAASMTEAPVRFGVELVGLVHHTEGVLARLVDGEGDEFEVRTRYVVAADGANSTVRELLEISTVGPGALAECSTVLFEADLRELDPAGVYATAHGAVAPLYPEHGWAWFGATPADHDDWAGVVSRAIGSGVPVEVLRVQPWTMQAFVAERFGRGRVLLAGDAAHAVPPTGGLGMNLGVADVHNLCWKLAGVLQGWAEPRLLDSYETERLPVAHRTLRQAVENAQLMAAAQAQNIEGVGIQLPWSEQYFAQLGLVLGVDYSAPAEPSGTDYLPTAEAGHRMPHLWLADGRSTLDAVGEWFTLFTPDPTGWKEQMSPWDVRIETLDGCDLGTHGALLVRPDGHIAAGWKDHHQLVLSGLPSL